jgi:hypothetical protein
MESRALLARLVDGDFARRRRRTRPTWLDDNTSIADLEYGSNRDGFAVAPASLLAHTNTPIARAFRLERTN